MGEAAYQRAIQAGMEPLPVDANSSQDEIVAAVIAHYADRLVVDTRAQGAMESAGIDRKIAKQLGIGFSDRTLGLRLAPAQWKEGGVVRERLCALGILRESGHEAFRGCVTVPVTDSASHVVGIVGLPVAQLTSSAMRPLFASGMQGGLFAPAGLPAEGRAVIVVSSVIDALAVASAQCRPVVAAGRERGFSADEVRKLSAFDVVLVGGDQRGLGEKLGRLGRCAMVASAGVKVASVLANASDRSAGLGSLMADVSSLAMDDDGKGPARVRPARSLGLDTPAGTAATTAGGNSHIARVQAPVTTTGGIGSPSSVTVTHEGGETHIVTSSRTWRVRQSLRRVKAESLKVALSVTDVATGRFHMDVVDLYQTRARNAFVESAATELRSPAESIKAEIPQVICAAEEARVERPATEIHEMAEAERAEAMELLTSPDLLTRVVCDLGSLGVIGEEANLAIAYLATISRLCERPFGVLIQSTTSAGKSTVADAVSSLVPLEDLVAYSAMTAKSLYYLSGADLSHKVLSIAEEEGAVKAAYPLKLLLSEGKLSIASTSKDADTGHLVTHSYEVAGPVSLLMTTTAADIDPELSNRLVVLGVDESATQTAAIVAAQRQASGLAGLTSRLHRSHLLQLHRNAQRLIRPLPVVIEDSPALATLPSTVTRHRRDHQKVLSVISALVLANQYQREIGTVEVDGRAVSYVVATPDDVERAVDLVSHVLSRRDDMAPQTAHLLSTMEDEAAHRSAEQRCSPLEVAFTMRELRRMTGWSERQVRAGLLRLVSLEYVVRRGSGVGHTHRFFLNDGDPPEESNRSHSHEQEECLQPRQPLRTSPPPLHLPRRGEIPAGRDKPVNLVASTRTSRTNEKDVGEGSYAKVGAGT